MYDRAYSTKLEMESVLGHVLLQSILRVPYSQSNNKMLQ
jgi:hypothetical protein